MFLTITWLWNSRRTARWLLQLAGLGLLLCHSSQALADISGDWRAETGQLAFVHLGGQDYEGTYTSTGSLKLRGRLAGRTFEGHWIAPVAPKACDREMAGSTYWGRIRFDFDAQFSRFTGFWAYCQETRWSGDWIGKRGGDHQAAEPEPLPAFAVAALKYSGDVAAGRCSGPNRFTLAVHGGAITGRNGDHSQKTAFIRQLLVEGRRLLAEGAGSLDMVHAAIRMMEDSGLFNAGRGATANQAGVIELDASIMEGRLRRAGAVAAVRGVKNAISAARLVMERSKHVLMVGPEADAFIARHGGESVDQDYFLKSGSDFGDVPLPEDLRIEPPGAGVSPQLAAFSGTWAGRWNGALNTVFAVERVTSTGADIIYARGTHADWGLIFGSWNRVPAVFEEGRLKFSFLNGSEEHFSFSLTKEGQVKASYRNETTGYTTETLLERLPQAESPDDHGTVGAVALDRCGDLAAGTSTGGFGSKTPGRVGDSPIIGAGTYADNDTAAISATGHGEYFIRYAVAYDITAMMHYKGVPLEEAATRIIKYKLSSTGLTGGIIAVDGDGKVAMPFNTDGMVRGSVGAELPLTVEVY